MSSQWWRLSRAHSDVWPCSRLVQTAISPHVTSAPKRLQIRRKGRFPHWGQWGTQTSEGCPRHLPPHRECPQQDDLRPAGTGHWQGDHAATTHPTPHRPYRGEGGQVQFATDVKLEGKKTVRLYPPTWILRLPFSPQSKTYFSLPHWPSTLSPLNLRMGQPIYLR